MATTCFLRRAHSTLVCSPIRVLARSLGVRDLRRLCCLFCLILLPIPAIPVLPAIPLDYIGHALVKGYNSRVSVGGQIGGCVNEQLQCVTVANLGARHEAAY